MTMRNLLPVQSQQERWSPFPRRWNPWKRTTPGWRNLLVHSKKAKRMMMTTCLYHSLRFQATSKRASRLSRNHVLKLHLLWNCGSHSIPTGDMFSCWTTSQCSTCVATGASLPGSGKQVLLWTWQAMAVVWRSPSKANSQDTRSEFGLARRLSPTSYA